MFDLSQRSPRREESIRPRSEAVREQRGQACYSARLLLPFLAVLGEQQSVSAEALAPLRVLDPDQRIYVAYAHSLLQCAEQHTGETLGLRASHAMTTGDAGMFDFLMSSADTPRMAIHAAHRYIRLISDSFEMSLTISGERAIARFESRIAIPRAGEDFAIASMIRNHIFGWPEGMLEDMDNGTPLGCDDPNGYHVKDDKQTLELLGDACKTLQQPSSQLSASFACQDVILL